MSGQGTAIKLDRGLGGHDPAAISIAVGLADGARTTAHVRIFDSERTEMSLAVLREPEPLLAWCERSGAAEALVGGFFVRAPNCLPLGEVRTHGVRRQSVPFVAPWHALRSCVHAEGGKVRVANRDQLAEHPRGDLLQAGPLLVRNGRTVVRDGVDAEGFSAGQAQFDSDITVGRYPRAAFGIGPGILLAVACDGRGDQDAGVTLAELAELMALLGAHSALNLDGGGSTSLISAGRLVNRPRGAHGVDIAGGRPIVTALTFLERQ